jgi:hypothetical protein
MGRERFEQLRAMLPPGALVVGIDEHTALILEPALEQFQVIGNGGVTLLNQQGERRFEPGSSHSMNELGGYQHPGRPKIPREVWAQIETAQKRLQEASAPAEPPHRVWELVEKRQAARKSRDWPTADSLRDQIAALGWQILDTPGGPQLEPAE